MGQDGDDGSHHEQASNLPAVTLTAEEEEDARLHSDLAAGRISKGVFTQRQLQRKHAPKLELFEARDGAAHLQDQLSYID